MPPARVRVRVRVCVRVCVAHLALDLRGGNRLLVANGGGLCGLRDNGGRLGLRAGLHVRPGCMGIVAVRGAGKACDEETVTSKTKNSEWTGT